jgi:hypothetical protein
MQYGLDKKRELLEAWKEARQAGVLQKEFCRANGVSERTLRAWIRDEEPVGARSIGKAWHILHEAAQRLLKLADALVVDDGLATKTDRRIERELGKVGSVKGLPEEGRGTEDREGPVSGMSEQAADSSGCGTGRDIGNEATSSTAAAPHEGAPAIGGQPKQGGKKRPGWDFGLGE